MNTLGPHSVADCVFEIAWDSGEAQHKERIFTRLDLWRDMIPDPIRERLTGLKPGDEFHMSFAPGRLVPAWSGQKLFTIERGRFDDSATSPCFGRFYPKGLLRGMPGIFPSNMEPFRCAAVNASELLADFNHPLAGRSLLLRVKVLDCAPSTDERGGVCTDPVETLTSGPGMQARYEHRPTDFGGRDVLARENEDDDLHFYRQPRLIVHTDSAAQEEIVELYGSILAPGMRVLDLMSSWRSHLPDSVDFNGVTGLGLNRQEMEQNPQLTEHVLHDLNREPNPPFPDKTFDAAICSVSVEYLVRPREVFAGIARILRPRGPFIVTFSNRWFPPKAIRIWPELHEFERMGLVLDHFLCSRAFEALETFSSRGKPRPPTDRYFPQLRKADPVYAVWGRKKG